MYLHRKNNEGEKVCSGIQVAVLDTLDRHFVDSKDITQILKSAGINPVGKKYKDINSDLIEKKLEENKLIKNAEAYKTTSGILKIEVYQKIPLMRIFSTNGNYFIDNEGGFMPNVGGISAYLPVASGMIEKDFAMKELYKFALFLQKNKFWDAQIEQIYVYPNKEIELIPRVGDHRILLGRMDNFEEKLNNLKLLYEKGLGETGWNRYAVINLKYKNQIVCTKK